MSRRDLQIPGIDPNATYAVQIRGLDADGQPGPWSSQFQFTTSNDTMPPAQPQNLSILVEGSNFMLDWDGVVTNEDGTDIDDMRDYIVEITAGVETERFTTVDDKFAFTISRNRTAFDTAQPSINVSVFARDRVGNESLAAAQTAVKPAPASSILAVVAKRNAVEMQWTDEDEDLSRFEIWKNSAKYAEVGGDTFIWTDTDVGAGAQSYYIKSVDRFGQTADSNTATEGEIALEIDTDSIPPNPPTNPAGTSEETGPNEANAAISWDAPVQDDDNTSYTDQEGYEVRYRTDAMRPWNYFRVPDLRLDGTTPENVKADIEQLPAGETLSWEVRAFDRSYNYSEWLSDTLVLAADTVAPDAPLGVSADGGIRTITVQWDRNTEDDLAGYRLYASETAAFTSSPTNLVFEGLGNAVSFSAGENETWYVRAAAYDHAGNESTPSTEESATTLSLGGGDVTPPADVTNAAATSTTYYHGSTEAARIAVSWDAVADTDLGAYIVSWRRDAGDWSEEQVGPGATTFLLTGAEPGVQYDFRIKAVDTSGNLSVNWSNIASNTPVSTNGDIQQEVSIVAGGAIESVDFDPLLPRGFRLDNNSLEIYGDGTHGVSVILGGAAGLNMNTVDDQLWFGAALFADANWRVDGLGNMRVGGAGSFYADQSGNIWSGNAVMASAPWEITAAGAARFNNIRITGANLAELDFLISAGTDFSMQKLVGGGFETRLAGDFIVDAGGDININGGSLSLTSGNITMNGGTLGLTGGAVAFDGAPVTINGSDFTVLNGSIVVNSGVNAAAPAIRSADYNYAAKTGWGFDNGNLYLFDGEIEASLITLQDAPNLLDHGFTMFSYDSSWYDDNVGGNGSSIFANRTSVWSRFGPYALRIQTTTDTEQYIWLGRSDGSTPTRVENGKTYIVSAYIKNNDTAAHNLYFATRDSAGIFAFGAVESFAAGEVKRMVRLYTSPGDATTFGFQTASTAADFIVDGVQVEEQVGTNEEPSAFKVGGVTTIGGGQITTGAIESADYSAGISGWKIDLNGDVEFETGVFRGDIAGADITGSSFVTDDSLGDEVHRIYINEGAVEFTIDVGTEQVVGHLMTGLSVNDDVGSYISLKYGSVDRDDAALPDGSRITISKQGININGFNTVDDATSGSFINLSSNEINIDSGPSGVLDIRAATTYLAGNVEFLGKIATPDASGLTIGPAGSGSGRRLSIYGFSTTHAFEVDYGSTVGSAYTIGPTQDRSLHIAGVDGGSSPIYIGNGTSTIHFLGVLDITSAVEVKSSSWKNHLKSTRDGDTVDWTVGSSGKAEIHYNSSLVADFNTSAINLNTTTVRASYDIQYSNKLWSQSDSGSAAGSPNRVVLGTTYMIISRHSATGLYVFRTGTNGRAIEVRSSTDTMTAWCYTSTANANWDVASDYRLKENVRDLDGSIEILRNIRPRRFDWIGGTDDDRLDDVGFIAHELQEHAPHAVSGEKDAVDEDGDISPQGTHLQALVPNLVQGWQEHDRRLAEQEETIRELRKQLEELRALVTS